MSSEFAQRNGFYYSLNPSYIPCVDLYSKIMEQDRSINNRFLFTKGVDDVVNKMSPDVKSKFEEAERLFVINNFETKEAKKNGSLKGINSDCVKTSWMEQENKVQEIKKNETFKQPLIVNREKQKTEINDQNKDFDQRNIKEIYIAKK